MNQSLAPGILVDGRFEIVRPLGRGGYGAVFEATQLATGQSVALKVLSDLLGVEPRTANRLRQRFERETQVVARLRHPHIVRLLDRGVLPTGEIFTVFDLVEGLPLEALLRRLGRLNSALAQHLMLQVIDALGAAHAAGVVHRDLKPENIMISKTSARPNAMVLDFGIAGVMEPARGADYQTLTQVGTTLGTLAYMPPEQLCGECLTPQSDIYAWGLLLMDCLAGPHSPTRWSPEALRQMHLSSHTVPIPDVITDAHLRHVIQRAVAKKLDQRFPDASTALHTLSAFRPPHDLDLTIPRDDAFWADDSSGGFAAEGALEGPIHAFVSSTSSPSPPLGMSGLDMAHADAIDDERTVVAPANIAEQLRAVGERDRGPEWEAGPAMIPTPFLDDEEPTRVAGALGLGLGAVGAVDTDRFEATAVAVPHTPIGVSADSALAPPAPLEGVQDVDDLLSSVALDQGQQEQLRRATFSPGGVLDLTRSEDSGLTDVKAFQNGLREARLEQIVAAPPRDARASLPQRTSPANHGRTELAPVPDQTSRRNRPFVILAIIVLVALLVLAAVLAN